MTWETDPHKLFNLPPECPLFYKQHPWGRQLLVAVDSPQWYQIDNEWYLHILVENPSDGPVVNYGTFCEPLSWLVPLTVAAKALARCHESKPPHPSKLWL